ncbi:MAG: competence protein ComEC [Microgenomates group bacterium Gr01-1014_5]|nr:MAG: competence protein ComEC [Microgenomates group bacterium Gr01-1014_5]
MRYWHYLLIFFLASLLLLVFALAPLFDNRLHLVFCDVGQGDGILIYQKQVQILVDAGADAKILSCLSGHMPFWDRRIEMAVITNADLDHYGGFIDIVRRYKIGAFAANMVGKNDLAFETLEKEIEKAKIKTAGLNSGQTIAFAKLKLAALWPDKDQVSALDTPALGSKVLGARVEEKVNPFSLVLKLSYGEFDALLTGDIVPPATDTMAERIRGTVEVLKVPHHGSKNGLTLGMLEVSSPGLAIISAGRNNRYGHPHKETLEMLRDLRVKTLRTDQEGEIEIVSDGQTWFVKSD